MFYYVLFQPFVNEKIFAKNFFNQFHFHLFINEPKTWIMMNKQSINQTPFPRHKTSSNS